MFGRLLTWLFGRVSYELVIQEERNGLMFRGLYTLTMPGWLSRRRRVEVYAGVVKALTEGVAWLPLAQGCSLVFRGEVIASVLF
jgi:hypothetical protein